MDLLQNPFHILAATPRDNRRRIMELADEQSLQLDTSECMEASSDLTNPRKRLSAEVAWFPGLSPVNIEKIVTWLSKPIRAMPSEKTLLKLTPIARANLLAYGLSRLDNHNKNLMVDWILRIAWAFEDIEPENVRVIINEERVVSGFPEVKDLSAVEAEIQERRQHYRQGIKSALDNLSAKELVEVVTNAVESATDNGEEPVPVLIADLVDSYEVEAQGFLEKEEGNIKVLVDRLRTAVDAERQDSALALMVSQLIQVVKNWDTVAQPIQVSAMSRGLDHDASHRVAWIVRDLAVHMFNEHGKLDFSQQLTNMLQEVFAEVGEVAERIADDTNALEEIAEQRARLIEDANNQAEEWRREITYEAEVGLLKPDTLRISPEGIEWKGRRWEFDSITRVRWGGTRHSVNGIPTGTTYSIIFGNHSSQSSIKLRKQAIYSNFIDRLWKTVGVRILTNLLKGLREGKRYRFGTAIVSDHGIELEKFRWIGDNVRVFCRWDELLISSRDGLFCVEKKDDKRMGMTFSYQNQDNIHVLEAALRMLWKRGGDRLSGLLGE